MLDENLKSISNIAHVFLYEKKNRVFNWSFDI